MRLQVDLCNIYSIEHVQEQHQQRVLLQSKNVNFGARRCLFLKKVAGLWPATLLKNRLRHRYFPMNFAKFLRTAFLQSTFGSCFYNNKSNTEKQHCKIKHIECIIGGGVTTQCSAHSQCLFCAVVQLDIKKKHAKIHIFLP